MKKILSNILALILFFGVGNVHAAKVLAPVQNSTAAPIGASDSSGNAIVLQGDATNGLEVDVTRISGAVSSVSSVGTINSVTNVVNVSAVGTLASVTSVSSVGTLTTVGTVNTVASVTNVSAVLTPKEPSLRTPI